MAAEYGVDELIVVTITDDFKAAPALLRAAADAFHLLLEARMTPESVYLPFNRDCLRGTFTPAKREAPAHPRARPWLIVQDQNLLVSPMTTASACREGALPAGCAGGGRASGSAPWAGAVLGARAAPARRRCRRACGARRSFR